MNNTLIKIGSLFLFSAVFLAACGGGEPTPTRTPVPTWTPTPAAVGQAAAAPPAITPGANAIGERVVDPTQVMAAIATETPTPLPTDTATPVPTDTPLPTDTPTVTETPLPTDTPTPAPTSTLAPTPTATPTPNFAFELEAAEKFPTDALAPNVVRIYAYVYSPAELGLPGYRLQVLHNGTPLVADDVSVAGVPAVTREDVSPYSRFTNLSVIFVEPQAGDWWIQLLDPQGAPVGPEAQFTLTADENTRELYVRYKQKQ